MRQAETRGLIFAPDDRLGTAAARWQTVPGTTSNYLSADRSPSASMGYKDRRRCRP
ncbi:hypothetical protein I541_5773 [Mycobacteroides abscessus]|nr:hypothetical protein I541_5773 [Mycobacteroides abscessus]